MSVADEKIKRWFGDGTEVIHRRKCRTLIIKIIGRRRTNEVADYTHCGLTLPDSQAHICVTEHWDNTTCKSCLRSNKAVKL